MSEVQLITYIFTMNIFNWCWPHCCRTHMPDVTHGPHNALVWYIVLHQAWRQIIRNRQSENRWSFMFTFSLLTKHSDVSEKHVVTTEPGFSFLLAHTNNLKIAIAKRCDICAIVVGLPLIFLKHHHSSHYQFCLHYCIALMSCEETVSNLRQ